MKKFFDDWATTGYKGMCDDFICPTIATEEEIIFASYSFMDYTGSATVFFVRNSKLYEVSGSHCSCNGLEEQWLPSEITFAALAMRKYVYDSTSWGGRMGEEACNAITAIIHNWRTRDSIEAWK